MFCVYFHQDAKESIRLVSLGKIFPRREIESLWGLLAFCAAGASKCDSTLMVRWKLVSSLFTFKTGVLAKPRDDSLHASEQQIDRCAQEIRYFGDLLQSHAMCPLPDDNSILIKLLQRGISLDVRSASLEKRWSRNKDMRCPTNRKDSKLVHRSWLESEHMFKHTSERYLAEHLLADYNLEKSHGGSIFSLSSSS